MDTVNLQTTRAEARALYRDYKKHVHHSEPIDRECMRAYQLLAQGRLVIRALESVKLAGVRADDGYPKLALVKATAKECYVTLRADGSACMASTARPTKPRRNMISDTVFEWPAGTFPILRQWQTWRATALVPQCPVHMRPQRGLANYHTLFEAEWKPVPPSDPYLLRRIGKADLWVVVAQWELTEVEKAVLSTRIGAM